MKLPGVLQAAAVLTMAAAAAMNLILREVAILDQRRAKKKQDGQISVKKK